MDTKVTKVTSSTVNQADPDQFGALGKNLAGAPCIAASSTSNHWVHTLTPKTAQINVFEIFFILGKKMVQPITF